ncbi:hypothetical protein Efla_001192 [Eimeria flavescens]
MSGSSNSRSSRHTERLRINSAASHPLAASSVTDNDGDSGPGEATQGLRDSCCVCHIPEALLASILRLIPLRERIAVTSLVCKQWLSLIRGRLCQVDSTIIITSVFLDCLRLVPPETQRATIKALAAIGRHAQLKFDISGPLHPNVHGGPSELRALQALLVELHDVRSVSISISCPVGVRLLGPTFAGLLQRSADTLVELEIVGDELSAAVLSSLLAAAPRGREGPSSNEASDAFLSAVDALEASIGSHGLRSRGHGNSFATRRADGKCQSMLVATALLLSSVEAQHRRPVAQRSQQQQQVVQQPPTMDVDLTDTIKDRTSVQSTRNRTGARSPTRQAGWRADSSSAVMNRHDLCRRIAELGKCCCCLAAADTAFHLYRSFQHVRLVLPRLKWLAVGDWQLLQVLHCPSLEELKLAGRSSAQQRGLDGGQQQQQQQGLSHVSSTLAAPGRVSSAIDELGELGAGRSQSPSASQNLLFFLMRCGSNLRRLHGAYPIRSVSDALLQLASAAGSDLPAGGEGALSEVARASTTARSSAAAPAIASKAETRQRPLHPAFVVAAVAAADELSLELESPSFLATWEASGAADAAQQAPAVESADATIGRLPAAINSYCSKGAKRSFEEAMAAAKAAASQASSVPFDEQDGVLAVAAALCVTGGGGCRHRRHLPGGCCAVPCAWGADGSLLLVLLPRLRVAHISDFLLLGFLLLPRLEELRLRDTPDTLSGNRTAGFALLWAYLNIYGSGLRVLETKGMAPPLAAFLGAGSTGEPLLSSIRPNEAAAAKTLRLLLHMHCTHPLMDPTSFSLEAAEGVAPTGAVATARRLPVAKLPAGADSLGSPSTSMHWQEGQQQQRIGVASEWERRELPTKLAVHDGQRVLVRKGKGLPKGSGSAARSEQKKNGCSACTVSGAMNERTHYGLKFGQLQQLQCHSTLLPYLVEPVPQCGSLRDLTTEGDPDEVLWFVALFQTLDSLCVRTPRLTAPGRRPRALETPPQQEGEPSTAGHRHLVTLAIRSYTGSAAVFGPHVRCPNLRQLQVQRRDDDVDAFLVGGGAPNLQVLHYYGHLFGGRGLSTLRSLVASHEMRVLRGNAEEEEKVRQLLHLLRLPRCFSPLKESPFMNLKELHVLSLDARAVVHVAFATVAAINPRLSRAWQLALRHRKEEQKLQLQSRQHSLLHRRQMQRGKEKLRLMAQQRQLYEAYTAARRRMRRFRTALACDQRSPNAPPQSLAGARPPNVFSSAHRELITIRIQLRLMQRRLEALAAEDARAKAAALDPRKMLQQQQRRLQRLQRGLQQRRRLRTSSQRFSALRGLLQLSVRGSPSYLPGALGGGNELRRLDETDGAGERAQQHSGQKEDFNCSRSWCFWACHRAVAALSQLLPQLRMCVVQQLRGNTSSLQLLLRGLPKLEVFAIEDSPSNIRKQRLRRLANNLGFTVRRGALEIYTLRNSFVSWVSTAGSRPFRILSRSAAGARAAAASISAADMLTRELLEKFLEEPHGWITKEHKDYTCAANSTAAIPPPAPDFPAAPQSQSLQAGARRAMSTSTGEQLVAPCRPAGTANSQSQLDLCFQENPTKIVTRRLCNLAGGAEVDQASWPFLSLPSLRCSIYGRKRRRGLTCTSSHSPPRKRQSRGQRTGGRSITEEAQQDLQMAKSLEEALEAQLTS